MFSCRLWAVTAAVATLPSLSMCNRITELALPSDAERFAPPEVYATWWNMTESCSGLVGSLSSVTWFKTNHYLMRPKSEQSIRGYWSQAGNQIVMAGTSVFDGGAVRHEMLHALIGKLGHPR